MLTEVVDPQASPGQAGEDIADRPHERGQAGFFGIASRALGGVGLTQIARTRPK
jgi:hypothetical protein